MKNPKFVIACGGTAGHVFPAVALADSLRARYPSVFILFAGLLPVYVKENLIKRGYQVCPVAGCAMPYRFNVSALLFPVKVFSSAVSALCVLKKWRPDVVISMGSFSGGAFVAAGKLSGLPVFIHEQNFMPGRANRLSAYFADKIAVSFPETSDFFPRGIKAKTVCTGNPVRREIFDSGKEAARASFGLAAGKFTILITGGSQGARAINETFLEAAQDLDERKFQVLHSAGNADLEFVNRGYRNLKITSRVFAFLEDMGRGYSACDLVISRCGATSIAEITRLGLASVLIPYPYGDGHQKLNAEFLKRQGAAKAIQQQELTGSLLSKTIKELSEDNLKLEDMRRNSGKLAHPEASEKLADEVLKLAGYNEIS